MGCDDGDGISACLKYLQDMRTLDNAAVSAVRHLCTATCACFSTLGLRMHQKRGGGDIAVQVYTLYNRWF